MKQNIKKNNQSVEKDAIKTVGFPSFEVFNQGLHRYLSGGETDASKFCAAQIGNFVKSLHPSHIILMLFIPYKFS